MSDARPPFRADHVGSLLRPPELSDARARVARGEIEGGAAPGRGQRDPRGGGAPGVGRPLVHHRRRVPPRLVAHRFPARLRRRRDVHQSFGVKFEGADEQPPLMKVTGKIRRARPSMLDHFTFLKSATTRTAKFCLPSPVMLHARGDRPTLRATYPDLDEFWADLTAAYREEIARCARPAAPICRSTTRRWP